MKEYVLVSPDIIVSFVGVLVSAVFALIGVLYSSNSARKAAKDTAKSEVEKMALLWKHEEELSKKKAIGEVCAYVSMFLWKRDAQSYKEAFVKINEVRSFVTGTIATTLDSICYDIEQRRNEPTSIVDDDIRDSLARMIDQCRQNDS